MQIKHKKYAYFYQNLQIKKIIRIFVPKNSWNYGIYGTFRETDIG